MPHDPSTPHDHDHVHGSGCCAGHGPAAPAAETASVQLPDDRGNPILVEVTRGGLVESVHRGRAVAVDVEGRVIAHWGDRQALVYPRSANKALQALPLVETGAADAFAVSDAELALACASHNGEPMHVTVVTAWLARLGLSAADLECGPQTPYYLPAWEDLVRQGIGPSPLFNNCSGKHTGMLATALHRGEGLRGYSSYHHAVQQRILGTIEQVTAQDLSRAPWGIDGCSIPTIGLPLEALAFGMARLSNPKDLPSVRAEAASRITRAWARHPEMVGGTGTFDTQFMQAVRGRILCKFGAEGVSCALLPGAGIGVAVKIDDGGGRAAGPAMAAVLRKLGILTAPDWQALAAIVEPPVQNRMGLTVGATRAGF